MMRVWPQRGEGDCTIACLAMLCNMTYEDALGAMTTIAGPKAHRRGAWNTQIIAAAAKFGVTLVEHKKFVAFEHATGILAVSILVKRRRKQHVVVLRWGLLFDPDDGVVWEPETYIETKKAKVGSLLMREG
jgi:ABC-type bacteriocin/lantibiotic exporter with double-glycine peptidase domain